MRFIKKNRKNRKNIIRSREVNTDKIDMLEKMYDSTYDIICEVQSKMLKFTLNMFQLYEKDMDKVDLLNS